MRTTVSGTWKRTPRTKKVLVMAESIQRNQAPDHASPAIGWLLHVPATEGRPQPTLADAEAAMIQWTLTDCRGNRRRAARLLGIARSTLLAKIRLYGFPEKSATEAK